MPKVRLVGLAASDPGVAPVPESGMLRLGFDPFEVMLMLPLTVPVAAGAKRAEKVAFCPAFRVNGSVSPLRLKPLPVAAAAEIVRLVPPELVSVPESDFEAPVATLPKLRLVGFATKSPAVVPVPESGRLTLPCAPVVVNVTLPLKVPLLVGAKIMEAEVLFPARSVIGNVMLPMVNPAPLRAAWSMMRSAVPLFEIVTFVF